MCLLCLRYVLHCRRLEHEHEPHVHVYFEPIQSIPRDMFDCNRRFVHIRWGIGNPSIMSLVHGSDDDISTPLVPRSRVRHISGEAELGRKFRAAVCIVFDSLMVTKR